jgi:nucleotide-binding universal stress UspA family protein
MRLRETPDRVGQRLRMQRGLLGPIMPGMSASRILVGYDGSPHADDALALARVLAAAGGQEIVLAQVVPWEPLVLGAVPVDELRQHFEERERAAMEELQRVADRYGVAAEAGPGTSPAQGLQELSDELDPELIVIGSSHRSRAGQVLAGNIGLRLLNGLDRPLAVAPAGYAERDGRLGTIGVGYDGSPESQLALQAAGRVASVTGAEIELIAATAPDAALMPHPWAFGWGAGTTRDDIDERMRGRLESAAGGLPHGVSHSERLQTGSAAGVLLEATRYLDLLVMGSRGYGPGRRLLLGSVSGHVVREAHCPLLVVPRSVERVHEPVSATTAAPA